MVQRTCCVLLALSAGCHAVRMVDTEADFREGTGAASAWSVSPSLAGKEFPALCDPVLVKEAGDLTKNRRGQFIFYLCKVYFRSGEGEKIETLTHEGSHHASSFTKDECSMMKDRAGQCVKSCGRPLCKQVASDMPQAAVNNADNYCYYINDLAMHGR